MKSRRRITEPLASDKMKKVPVFDKPVKKAIRQTLVEIFLCGSGGRISKRAVSYTISGLLLFGYALLCFTPLAEFHADFGMWLLGVAGAAGFAYHANERGKFPRVEAVYESDSFRGK